MSNLKDAKYEILHFLTFFRYVWRYFGFEDDSHELWIIGESSVSHAPLFASYFVLWNVSVINGYNPVIERQFRL